MPVCIETWSRFTPAGYDEMVAANFAFIAESRNQMPALLRELSALRQRVGELENMLADYGDETVVSDGWPAAQNRVLAEADNLAAARQAGEGR
jgi:hypothetical protein